MLEPILEEARWQTSQIQGGECRAQTSLRGSIKAKGEGLVGKQGEMG